MYRIGSYVSLAIIFIIAISILYLPILFILKKKGINIIRQISYVGLFCSIFLIIFATILFVPITFNPENHILNIDPFNWLKIGNSSRQFIIEKIPNIMLFIPFGLFIPILFINKRKFYKILLISFIMTFSIEFLQYFVGRSSDIVDVMTNLLGGIIGYVFFKVFNKLFANQKWWNKLIASKI